MYKKYEISKKSNGNSNEKSKSNFKPTSIYCTCVAYEKNSWLQNFCNKCSKQIHKNDLNNEGKELISNNESFQKIYNFVKQESKNEDRPRNFNLNLNNPKKNEIPEKIKKENTYNYGDQNVNNKNDSNYLGQNIYAYNNIKTRMSPNQNIEIFKKRLNEIEKNFNNNYEDTFFTPDIKITKSKTFYEKKNRNISPSSHIEETTKKNHPQPTPPSYSKNIKKSQAKTVSSSSYAFFDNSSNNKNNNHSNSKKEVGLNLNNKKGQKQQQKKTFGNKESSKTLHNFNQLPIAKVKKTQTLKSQTSRPKNNYEAAANEINKAYEYLHNPSNHVRAKSALRYQNQIEENNREYNKSFNNLNLYGEDKGYLTNDTNFAENDVMENPEEFLKRYQKINYVPQKSQKSKNYNEEHDDAGYFGKSRSSNSLKYPYSQSRINDYPMNDNSSQSHKYFNFDYGMKSEKSLANKGYLINNVADKDQEEREYRADLKNLSIDEKLSTKKISKMLNNDYKFIHKNTELLNFEYEEPENDYFENRKKNNHQERDLKRSVPQPIINQVINEKTEENTLEGTETYIPKENFPLNYPNKLKNSPSLTKSLQLKFCKKYCGHKNTVNSLAYDFDQKTLWSGSHDYSIKAWQIFTNNSKCYKDLKRHKRWVWKVLYDESSKRMFTGGADNLIRVWDPNTFTQTSCLKGHVGGVICLENYESNMVLSGSGDQTIKLWDLEQNSCVSSFEEHRQRVTSLHKIQDGNSMVLSGSADNLLKGWDCRSENSVFSYKLHDDAIVGLHASQKNSKEIISVSLDHMLKKTDLRNGKTIFEIDLGSEIHCLAKIEHLFLLGTKQISIFDPSGLTVTPILGTEHSGNIKDLLYIPITNLIFSCGGPDHNIFEWTII